MQTGMGYFCIKLTTIYIKFATFIKLKIFFLKLEAHECYDHKMLNAGMYFARFIIKSCNVYLILLSKSTIGYQ